MATSMSNRRMPNVQFTRFELRNVLHLYDLIRDCLGGSSAVKKRGSRYLPVPNAEDISDENRQRYEAYLLRAVFYNVLRRTVYALIGQIFLRDPQVDIPASLDVLKLDANGEGVPLDQMAKSVALYAIAYGRGGVHVDYPTTGNVLTRADLDTGDMRPIIATYEGRDIINWRKALRGARMVYTLIVVREDFMTNDDGFEAKTSAQFKVMRLVPPDTVQAIVQDAYPDNWNDMFGDALLQAYSSKNDVYMIEVWRSTGSRLGYNQSQAYIPRASDGSFLNEIPFKFIGSESNDDSIDHPPVADMAELNISHYRNSADLEESSFLVGQPTPVVSGVTEEWAAKVLKGAIQLGSRGVIALPNGGTAELMQAGENTLVSANMDRKERQMVALGAKLVEQRQVQRTATEAQMEGTADTSILATIAKNVSDGIEWAVKTCCKFTGDNPDLCTFKLNTEFDLTRMDPAERQQLLLEYQGGAIAFEEMRANLRRGGVATLDDAEAKTAIDKDNADRLAAQVDKVSKLAAVNPTQKPGSGVTQGE